MGYIRVYTWRVTAETNPRGFGHRWSLVVEKELLCRTELLWRRGCEKRQMRAVLWEGFPIFLEKC